MNPKVVVLLAGTNNIASGATASDVVRGVQAIVTTVRSKAPQAAMIVTGIFPRNDEMILMPVINEVNASLARMSDGTRIRVLQINDKLADAEGRLFEGMMNPDKLHPALKAYQLWADGLKPIFTELLGQPTAEDHGPAPTGDPGVR